MSLREAFLVVHRWIGIGAGVFFCIASMTGAVLVFEPELHDLMTRSSRRTSLGDVGAAAVELRVREEFPDARIAFFRPPQTDPGVYRIDIESGAGNRTIFVSAGTGRVLPGAKEQSATVLLIRRLHTNLVAGRPGVWLVTSATIVAALGMVTGIVLWWPGLRRLARGFVIRFRRTFYILNYDVHQVIGIFALPLLLVITLTGALLPFGGMARRLSHAVYAQFARPGPVWPAVRVQQPSQDAAAPARSASEILRSASSAIPDGQPLGVVFPRGSRSPIEARLLVGGVPSARSIATVLIDPHSGDVLSVRDPRSLAPGDRLYTEGLVRLHVGGFDSVTLRILYALACVAGVLLVPTGFVVWWLKRTRLELAEERRRTRAAIR